MHCYVVLSFAGAKMCPTCQGWLLVVLRINVDLAIFQPYLDLEARDNQYLNIQVARPGIEPRSSCIASQELNHSATAAPQTTCEGEVYLGRVPIEVIIIEIVTLQAFNIFIEINTWTGYVQPAKMPRARPGCTNPWSIESSNATLICEIILHCKIHI